MRRSARRRSGYQGEMALGILRILRILRILWIAVWSVLPVGCITQVACLGAPNGQLSGLAPRGTLQCVSSPAPAGLQPGDRRLALCESATWSQAVVRTDTDINGQLRTTDLLEYCDKPYLHKPRKRRFPPTTSRLLGDSPTTGAHPNRRQAEPPHYLSPVRRSAGRQAQKPVGL